MTNWTVVVDIAFIRALDGHSLSFLRRVDQIQRLLAREGPDGLKTTPVDTRWSDIKGPVSRMAIAPFDREVYLVYMDVRPGLNIIIRGVVPFDRPNA
ncbi:MAG: hypothetical protein WDM92_08850 [Caulobacteraceae bacterium]